MSWTQASGPTVITFLTITSAAFMIPLLCATSFYRPTGEFFDLNQEPGTLFHGSLAASSRMRDSGGSNGREASDAGDGHRPGDAGRAWCRAGDRTIEPRPRSGPAAMRGMSCRAKGILAIPQRQCASLPGYRLHSRHDRNRVIGRAQYLTSHDAQHHARSRRASRHHRLYSEPQMNFGAPWKRAAPPGLTA